MPASRISHIVPSQCHPDLIAPVNARSFATVGGIVCAALMLTVAVTPRAIFAQDSTAVPTAVPQAVTPPAPPPQPHKVIRSRPPLPVPIVLTAEQEVSMATLRAQSGDRMRSILQWWHAREKTATARDRAALHDSLHTVRVAQNAAFRSLLTPDQRRQFDANARLVPKNGIRTSPRFSYVLSPEEH